MPTSSSNVILNRRQSTNQCYTEVLAEEILPLRMMQIPAGKFLMGSPEDELDRSDQEGPQHEVRVSEFFMAKYPVTQAQWKFVASLPQVNKKLESDPSTFKGEYRPVERVSWHDAVEFCARLSARSGRQYRLPSEAEWEYGCRAGTTAQFHLGETITTDIANYRGTDNEEYKWSGSYGDGPKGDFREETTPVNNFEGANRFGLSDMHGNVWEWCQDYWHENYEGAPEDGSAWVEGDNSSRRIIRGGSWDDSPRICRSASRFFNFPVNRLSNFGFRVVCSPPRTL